jgi:hypothetical protein
MQPSLGGWTISGVVRGALFVGLVSLAACGGEADGRLGVEGASCLRTADCEAPLQCIANVCVGPGAPADVAPGDSSGRPDAPPLVFDDVHAQRDASADASPSMLDARDTAAPPRDVWQPFDVGPDWTPAGPDIHLHPPDTYGACGELGIASAWSGGFDGSILFWNVQAPPGFEGQVPESGTLQVYGDLSFEIRCLEQKLIVVGTLRGFGEAIGEMGSHPFTATLTGEYDPRDDSITATIDGSVRLYYVFEIYFEGRFPGALSGPGRFDGDWDGAATGNNLNLRGEARGGGDWWAESP